MLPFRVHILGCGSAKPSLRHNPSAQIVEAPGRLFLVDCGEGTQRELCRQHIAMSRISHVFISHLHGDHCYGLPGLLNTLALQGGRGTIHIYAFADFVPLFKPLIDYHMHYAELQVVMHPISKRGGETIYDDKAFTVTTLSLQHRVPCVGFVFREKPLLPHIRRDMIDFLHIPHYAINAIKQGEGWTTEDGVFYPHERLVTPNHPPRSYVYMTDTMPCPELAAQIRGTDLLYHEATFCEDKSLRAEETGHSTARQAALFAAAAEAKKLLIGHYSARYPNEIQVLKEAKTIFPNTIAAGEGLVVDV